MANSYNVVHALKIVADRNDNAADILRAEIERLHKLSASAQKCAEEKTAMIAELHKQRDEIERLRNQQGLTFTDPPESYLVGNRQFQEQQAEIERLQKCCTQRGARMQKIYKLLLRCMTCETISALEWNELVGWFDVDGVPVEDAAREGKEAWQRK